MEIDLTFEGQKFFLYVKTSQIIKQYGLQMNVLRVWLIEYTNFLFVRRTEIQNRLFTKDIIQVCNVKAQ